MISWTSRTPAASLDLPPFVRVPIRWVLRRRAGIYVKNMHDPDLSAANHAVLDDLHGGVTSLLLRLDRAAREGLDPDDRRATELAGRDGLAAYHREDLATVLQDVDLTSVGVTLDAGAAFLPAAALLAALWRQRTRGRRARPAAHSTRIRWRCSRSDGQLPVSPTTALKLLADLAAWTAQTLPHVTAVGVDTSPYHHAGATAAQDIACGLATAVSYSACDGGRRAVDRRCRASDPV